MYAGQTLLCGPGPANIAPEIRDAMTRPLLSHLDGDFVEVASQVVRMLAHAYRRQNGLTLPISSTGTGGLEAGIAALVQPGDTVIVAVSGFFGSRGAEVARRHGATVVELDAPAGRHIPTELILDTVRLNPTARALFVVHAETSTGVLQPLEELRDIHDISDLLVIADCVTSLGGNELDVDSWNLDYCFGCTQKCIGGPPGLSPVSLSDRAMATVRARLSRSFAFDFERLEQYWVTRPPTYHHTAPILEVYALHEALRLIQAEGIEERWRRHSHVGRYFQEAIRGRGLEVLTDPASQLPQLTCVLVPKGIEADHVRRRLLVDHGVEVGGGLGSGPPMWRVGLMGENAQIDVADRVLAAFDEVLGAA